MKRAALYGRVSTDRQREEATIESQVLELRKQIAQSGNVLVKEYIDDGYSGKLLDRPALDELRRDAKGDVFDAIYFHSADRLARKAAHQTIIVDELLRRGSRSSSAARILCAILKTHLLSRCWAHLQNMSARR